MRLVVECIPAVDGVAAAPCGTLNGVALAPIVTAIDGGPLDYSGLGQLFAWSLSFVLLVFVAGHVVGAIVRVIRSA